MRRRGSSKIEMFLEESFGDGAFGFHSCPDVGVSFDGEDDR